MTESDALTTDVQVARGEMQAPWSDYSGQSFAAGGPLLEAMVERLELADAARVLVVGPHTVELVRAVAGATGGEVTVLVRGVADAELLQQSDVPATIVAGALDGFAESGPQPFDVIVALDGLDRVLSYDSGELSFEDTMRVLLGLAGDDARAVVAHSYDASPVNILDARPEKDRFGDDEFRPLHGDPTRPTTAEALIGLIDALTTDGPSDLVTVFGPPAAPRLGVAGGPETLDLAAPAVTSYVVEAARAHRRPLLAQPDELIRTLSRGGRLGDAADGGIVLLGCTAEFDVARVTPAGILVFGGLDAGNAGLTVLDSVDVTTATWPDDAATETLESDTAQPSETAKYVHEQTAPGRVVDAGLAVALDLLPAHISLSPTVEDEFVRLAELGDVPAFRELAEGVGAFVESQPVTERRVLTFDDLHIDGRTFSPGTDAARWSEVVGTTESLAAAFWLLEDRMRGEHLRQPWPDHVQGESLVSMWVEMAGHPARTDAITDGRQLADAVRAARPRPSGAVPDLRTALADAAAARKELADSQGQVFGLERTIGFRDKQLRTREQVIRNMRESGKGGTVAAQQARANTMVRIAKRTAQVRSVGELTAGVGRIYRRAQRNKAAAKKKA